MAEEQFLNPQFQQAPSKESKRLILFSILVILLIFVFGIIGVLASRIWDPLWNPFRPSPEKVIGKMVLEIEKVKTLEQKMEFLIKIKNQGDVEVKLISEGKEDKSQPEKQKIAQKFDILVSFSEKEAPIGAGMKFALAGETRTLEEESYFKFTTLPAIPFFEMMEIDFSQIEDQWIKVDQESIIDFIKELAKDEWMPEMEKMVEEFEKKLEERKIAEKEIQEKVKKILSERTPIFVKKEFPDEEIDGIKVYHYLIGIDKNKLLETIPELWKIIEEEMLKEYGTSITFNEKELTEKLGEIFDKIGDLEGEIWIGKKDYLPYRIKGEKTLDLAQFNSNEEGTVSLILDIKNSRFNQPIEIEAPSEYKELKEILIPVFEEYMKILEENRSRAKDARIMANMSQVRSIAELIYSKDNSYKNLCYNLTLNENAPIYGTDLMIIEKDIKESQGGVLSLNCYSSKESYCVVGDLASFVRGKLCIDSMMSFKEISDNSGCLGIGTTVDPYRCPEGGVLGEKFASYL